MTPSSATTGRPARSPGPRWLRPARADYSFGCAVNDRAFRPPRRAIGRIRIVQSHQVPNTECEYQCPLPASAIAASAAKARALGDPTRSNPSVQAGSHLPPTAGPSVSKSPGACGIMIGLLPGQPSAGLRPPGTGRLCPDQARPSASVLEPFRQGRYFGAWRHWKAGGHPYNDCSGRPSAGTPLTSSSRSRM
jgi:hypothetical protein